MITCPTCQTKIDPDERCPAVRGMGRCMEKSGHEGWHWTDMGSGDGSIWRWTGVYAVRSCVGRLSLSEWCVATPGHKGGHNNGRGTSFGDPEEICQWCNGRGTVYGEGYNEVTCGRCDGTGTV